MATAGDLHQSECAAERSAVQNIVGEASIVQSVLDSAAELIMCLLICVSACDVPDQSKGPKSSLYDVHL